MVGWSACHAASDEVVVDEARRLYGGLRQNACAHRLMTSAAGRACCHHVWRRRRASLSLGRIASLEYVEEVVVKLSTVISRSVEVVADDEPLLRGYELFQHVGELVAEVTKDV